MGVDTKVLLKSNPQPLELMLWAQEHYKQVSLTPSGVDGFVYLNFKDGEDQRNLSIFFDNECRCDWEGFYTGDATYISMGCWGNSERIARSLVRDFGGWFIVDDSKDDWTRLDQ